MNDAHSIEVLNRLLAIQYRSLPMYLIDARPESGAGERAAAVLAAIVTAQQNLTGRIAELILDRRGSIEPGEYPMEFTNTHLVALDFLVTEIIHYQRQDVRAIERCSLELADDPAGRALAEESLGTARAHLEMLEELLRQPHPPAIAGRVEPAPAPSY